MARHLVAATMGVTVALENARRRGLKSREDTRYLNQAEVRQYHRLCQLELGITEQVMERVREDEY